MANNNNNNNNDDDDYDKPNDVDDTDVADRFDEIMSKATPDLPVATLTTQAMTDDDDDDDNDAAESFRDDDVSLEEGEVIMTRTVPDLPVATLLDNEEGEREDAELREELQRLRQQERDAIRLDMELPPTKQQQAVGSPENNIQRNHDKHMLWMSILLGVGLIAAAISIPFSVMNRRSKSFQCFDSLKELEEAVDRFVEYNDTDRLRLNNMYGLSMSTWCVSSQSLCWRYRVLMHR